MNTVETIPDSFQQRYLAHQERKRDVLLSIMRDRHSNRIFGDDEVPPEALATIYEAAELCPSSCDRHGVKIVVETERDRKALLGGLLVGGVGWIHRAPVVMLLFGDRLAYKAGNEIDYMVYLDAGVMIQQMFLTATAIGLHACYCNPNIRDMNKDYFRNVFGSGVFCGALAVGWPPQ